MDEVLKKVKKKTNKLHVGYYQLNPVYISECLFADDIAIIGKTKQDLQENISVWEEEIQKIGLNINTEKTKIMKIGDVENVEITINNEEIEQVTEFKYLGAVIHNEGNIDQEINQRIQSATKAYHALNNIILKNKNISKKTKMTLYKTVYRPILIYGCESWVLNNTQLSKLQAMEMKYLRRVKGITRLDRIRNTEIRAEMEIEELKKTIENKQLQWLGHIMRMEDTRQTKNIWQAKARGKRKRGRPGTTT